MRFTKEQGYALGKTTIKTKIYANDLSPVNDWSFIRIGSTFFFI